MNTCSTCTGTGRITTIVPNIKRQGGVEYQSSNPPYVERHFTCDTCTGSGHQPVPVPAREGAMTTSAVQRRIAIQTAEDRQRLAAKGEREGVRILVDHRTGQHVATSASNPTGCYHVTVAGCTCRGFMFWGRCKHHSLLLAELGHLEVTPEPDLVVLPAGQMIGDVVDQAA